MSLALLSWLFAQGPLVAATSGRPPSYVADARVGPTLLARSQSKAPPHLLRPSVRLGLRTLAFERLEIGGALTALVTGNEHYRVLGGLVHARWAVWQNERVSFGAAAALGAGYDADILASDLVADGSVRPYGFVALDARWALGRRWLLGAEAGFENLSMWNLGLLVGLRLGGGR